MTRAISARIAVSLWLLLAVIEPAAPATRATSGASQGAAFASPAVSPPAASAASEASPAASRPPPPLLSFDAAVGYTTYAVFNGAPAPGSEPIPLVIDPLIDGSTGYRSRATQAIQSQIEGIVKRDFPRYSLQRITSETLRKHARVLVGTFTTVNGEVKPAGDREAFWFCLVLLDLDSGKIVARSVVRVPIRDADPTPTAIFRDSPAWTSDPSVQAYVSNCQGSKVGDPINPAYIDGLLTAALINEAGDDYDAGKYADALDLYRTARKAPAGDQLRVYNGIYLSLFKLGRAGPAADAFRDLVDFGFREHRLAMKFLFRPGSVRFAADSEFSASYDGWIRQIAAQAETGQVCLQIIGHTGAGGPAAMNDSLSLLRAEYVQTRLEDEKPQLKNRTVAAGVGSRETLIGNGRDDASDILDRRVELKPINPCR
jgi:outer membrane protein OmpA-like peptidoglycan-associated protein